jgi:RNA polymerase sigma-70 factor (ECF subfamily)
MESDLEALDLLDALKPKYRTVMHLFYYERYRTNEIAAMLGKNENTIRSQLARGREQLRAILTDESEGGLVYEQQI